MRHEIRDTVEFPGFSKFPEFLERFLANEGIKKVLDVGGGANPMIRAEIASQIQYDLLDIDVDELAKADKVYNEKFCIDACDGTEKFRNMFGDKKYDLIFSHMFLEHISNPDQLHKNLIDILSDQGIIIHAYPSNKCIPMMVNFILPEAISSKIARFAQPKRDFDGKSKKFPAYYRKCEGYSLKLHKYFKDFGYETVSHISYAGHDYYSVVSFLSKLEKITRKIVIKLQIPWICYSLIILKKRHD